MNPVDHPMGGGEGRASGGHPRSRKGLIAKGYKTRTPKKHSNKFIIDQKNIIILPSTLSHKTRSETTHNEKTTETKSSILLAKNF
jgi:hypothetical protein